MERWGEGQVRRGSGRVSVSRTEFEVGKWRVWERVRSDEGQVGRVRVGQSLRWRNEELGRGSGREGVRLGECESGKL